jgi:hypothetical protein
MIRINAENIYALRNSTGKPLTDLIDRLIRSSAVTLGISSAAVLDNPRVNYPDGGVDTQVTEVGSSDTLTYFNVVTVWQYKAVALKDFSDAKAREEISGTSKSYVRALLGQGYGHRLCIGDDGSAERKAEIKSVLNAEIKKVNPTAPDALVLFASDIVDWVNMFPAIAAEMLGASLTNFFHFNTWQNRERAFTKLFVATTESDVIFQSIGRHLDWKGIPTTTRITVSGDAGVGKSRTVVEAIAALPEVAPLTLYTDDEDKALDVARALSNQQGLYAVLVADECTDATAFQIAKLLQGTQHRIRLITIDNALERMDKSDLRLSAIGPQMVEKIVEANFPAVESGRRYRYCQLAEGYLRFAIFLCDNDDLIVREGHLGTLLHDTKSYLSTVFDKDGPFKAGDFTALMVISLIQRCGARDNLFSDLQQLCALVGLDAKDIRERLYRMQRTNGLVGRAGRYLFVTPTPVAMVCFQAAWSRWAEPDPRAFLEAFPKNLVPSFLARMARAPEEVGSVVNAYFRDWAISRGGSIFADANETKQFLLLVRSYPDAMIPKLHQLIKTATPEQLGGQYSDGRRQLVTDATEIASFPQWFPFAEDILFFLARYESEPGLGNNATKVWAALFPIRCNVATPFPERLQILRTRLVEADKATKLLCVEALVNAIDDRSLHMISGEPYGNRIAPSPWSPKTWPELYDHLKQALSELNLLSRDEDEAVREKATASFIASIRSLVFHGMADQAKDGAGNLPDHVRPILRSELREFVLLNNSEYSPHSEHEKRQRAESVEEWIAELASSDFHGQLIEDVGSESWDHHLEQDAWDQRIRKLATRLLNVPSELELELPWLSSDKARSSVQFGDQVGRLDLDLRLLDRILKACQSARNPNLARGYFSGASQTARLNSPSAKSDTTRSKLNAALDVLWEGDPTFAFNVMTMAGDFVDAFGRAIMAVHSKRLGSDILSVFVAWNGSRHTLPAEVRIAAETLLEAAATGDEDAADIGIEFIVFALMRASEEENKLEMLQGIFEDQKLDVVFGLLERSASKSQRGSHWFSQIFARVMPANPDNAVSILLQMMQSASYETSKAAAELFVSVATVRPQQLMERIGELMMSGDRNTSFLFRKYPIISLPDTIVIDWVERHGLEGARHLARHMPGPFVGSDGPNLNPVTRHILEKFGDDDTVFSRWAAGLSNGQVFTGSIADYTERRAALAEPFLDFPIEAVRRWARGQVEYAEEYVPKFRISEEESGF